MQYHSTSSDDDPDPQKESLSAALGSSEEQLMSHALARSDPHFDNMCEHYYPLLYRFVRLLIGKSHYAEDIVQETLMAASDHWHKLRTAEEKSLRGWLYKTAKNKFYDHYRRQRRRPEYPLTAEEVRALERQALESIRDIDEQIWLTMEKLSLQERECIIYVWLEGYSIEETANMLHIRQSTVRGYLTRGRQKFTQIYHNGGRSTS